MIPLMAFGPVSFSFLAVLGALISAFGLVAGNRPPVEPEQAYRELEHRLRHPWKHRLQAPARWFR